MTHKLLKALTLEQKEVVDNIISKSEEINTLSVHCPMGSGKTPMSLAVSLVAKFDVIWVICPASLSDNWEREGGKYGVPLDYVMSYDYFRGTCDHQPKHNFFKRVQSEDDDSYTYEIQDKLVDLFNDKKVLIIVDEYQNLTNENDIQKAFASMHTYFRNNNTKDSFVLTLSGTPFEKEEHVINYMKCVGIIQSKVLATYSRERNFLKLEGLQEVIDFAKSINEELTEEILKTYKITNKNVEDICYILYVKIIEDFTSVNMPPPKLPFPIFCRNAFYNMDPENTEKINKGLKYLDTNGEKQNFENIQKGLMLAQEGKVEKACQLIINILETIPNSKVCLYADYDSVINTANEVLSAYGPQIIRGSVPKSQRMSILDPFQKDTLECRLLILNSAVCSVGLNLDDIYGDFPRYVFVMPSYYVKRMHQITRRFYRLTTKSSPQINFMYCKSFPNEISLLNVLCQKSNIMMETLKEHTQNDIKFPSQYDTYVEDAEDNTVELEVVESLYAKKKSKSSWKKNISKLEIGKKESKSDKGGDRLDGSSPKKTKEKKEKVKHSHDKVNIFM